MKNLFQKYYNSTLNPDEFNLLSKIVFDKKNEPGIFNEMKLLWDKNLIENTALPKPKLSLLQKIKGRILKEEYRMTKRKVKAYSLGLKIAAVFIIGLLISTVFFLSRPSQNKYSERLQTITTPFGAKTSTTLPDGSLVWLNSGSTLSFPNIFDKNRLVKLKGEAFFQVSKNGNPFIVSTMYGEVEVKGTSFNVKAFSGDLFETTLVEGSVIVRDKNTKEEISLNPGQQAVINNDGIHVQEVVSQNFTSWTDGKLIFSKEPFPEFITQLERWYNVTIEYNDPELDEIWYTGTIEMETISEVMEMITKVAPVRYSYDKQTRSFTITSK